MKKFLELLVMFVLIFMIPSEIFAQNLPVVLSGSNKILLEDMSAHPSNYVFIGGGGPDRILYVSKPSIDVQQYAPPKYIISVKRITIYNIGRRDANNNWYTQRSAEVGTCRYLYDYNAKKIYVESNSNGKASWQLIDLSQANKGNVSPIGKDIRTAEFAFYLAYKKSFFDKPLSDEFRVYIDEGK